MSSAGRDAGSIGVLCVDDNPHVAEALRVKLSKAEGFVWHGWLSCADELVELVQADSRLIVLLDLDMPGRDPFEMLVELSARCPECKVIMFTGHVRGDLIERAIDSGVWGYVAKSDGEEALLEVMKRVARGSFAMSTSVQSLWGN
jgi:two-component system response regulator YesN